VLVSALSYSGLLSPLYLAAFRTGGAIAVVPVTVALNILWGGLVLLLFLALRAAVGGVPTLVAAADRENAFTSRGGEIGAFVIAYLLIMVAILMLNGLFLSPIYASLSRSGQTQIVFAIGLVISLINAVLVYAIFIGLRPAFCRQAQR